MIVLDESTPRFAVEGIAVSLARSYSLELKTTWKNSLRGFLVSGAEENIEAMVGDPRIKFAEQNFRTRATEPRLSATQWTWWNGDEEYMWHLDRIDEVLFPGDSQHNMCTEGRTVYAYVIDTGVQSDHEQFETPTRVVMSKDFSPNRSNQMLDFTDDQTNGCTASGFVNWRMTHGTAVASVLAGTQVGAAKTQVISLKVGECGSMEIRTGDVIDALEWVGTDGSSDPSGASGNPFFHDPGVINHSGFVPHWDDDLGGTPTDFSAYSDAVEGLVQQVDKPFFTSADNFSTDACLFSPNDNARTNYRQGTVFVVGGTTMGGSEETENTDYRSQTWIDSTTPDIGQDSGSNSGACVSVYAPGTAIFAARSEAYFDEFGVWYDRATGTSFASPIVAAIAARHMEIQEDATGQTPGAQAVYQWLLDNTNATIHGVDTPAYWYCGNGDTTGPSTYRSNPPTNCPGDSWGRDQNGVWGSGFPPAYFPTVGNDSDAAMIYFDEGYCP
ncbi:MAG TPA: S8 family serine peptidase [Thermoanaerobaculia bacterium]|nr:S8 family serine peptidase [Thermoanaerobaculia bacterium]